MPGAWNMSIDSVLEQVWRINPPYVCITGGEPLLQSDELEHLLGSLSKRGTIIDIETNGTIDFSRFYPYASDLHGCEVPVFRRAERS